MNLCLLFPFQIKEASEKAVITAKPPKVVKKAAPTEVPAEKPRGGSANPKPVTRKPVSKTQTFVKKSVSSTSLNQKRAPSASARPKSAFNGVEDELGGSENDDARYPESQDLVARVDISSKITPALVDELMHKDWKVRSNWIVDLVKSILTKTSFFKVRTEAVNKLQSIITEAKNITGNLGEAVPAIIERLTDSNGRLAAASVSLCESIAVAMGPSCKTYIRDFFPSMLQGLGDSKVMNRPLSL